MRRTLGNPIQKGAVGRPVLFCDLVGEWPEAIGEGAGGRRAGLSERLERGDFSGVSLEALQRGNAWTTL
jgi:hypothetical protein